jgi:hypothetical protein
MMPQNRGGMLFSMRVRIANAAYVELGDVGGTLESVGPRPGVRGLSSTSSRRATDRLLDEQTLKSKSNNVKGRIYYQDATDTGQQRKSMPTRARRGRINVDVVVYSPAVLS